MEWCLIEGRKGCEENKRMFLYLDGKRAWKFSSEEAGPKKCGTSTRYQIPVCFGENFRVILTNTCTSKSTRISLCFCFLQYHAQPTPSNLWCNFVNQRMEFLYEKEQFSKKKRSYNTKVSPSSRNVKRQFRTHKPITLWLWWMTANHNLS